MTIQLIQGDCLEVMRGMEDNSVDSVVTDPPYGLSFMGKKWDYDVPSVEVWEEVLRVLKPGGHLLSFGGTRTYHRMVVNIEDAGFEIRDQIMWLYGSGFPKSHNISKAIDKMKGAAREEIGGYLHVGSRSGGIVGDNKGKQWHSITAPATPEAEQGDGWGSALKPANEPICLARKPLSEKAIVENVLKWGVGGLNIDGCRIGTEQTTTVRNGDSGGNGAFGRDERVGEWTNPPGRFPANVILDEEAGRMLDEMSGELKSGAIKKGRAAGSTFSIGGEIGVRKHTYDLPPSSGGASRFFYCAKASKKERDAGLDELAEKKWAQWQTGNGASGKPSSMSEGRNTAYRNTHPTVKPLSLMRYLCRLITPPGGVVLDPFMGSGSTGCGAVLEGFGFIGIEREAEYLEIAKRRIGYWQEEAQMQPALI